MIEAYTRFSDVYDELMHDIPYEKYVDLLEMAIGPLSGKKILDIGCGTGTLAINFAKKGAIVTGVDASLTMLEIARERTKKASLAIHYVEQQMQKLDVSGQFDAAIIAIDSINYVTKKDEVQDTFERIFNALSSGGTLLFDVHSTFKMEEIFMESPFIFDNGRIVYIWETDSGDEPLSVYSNLSFFVQTMNGTYERFNEEHYQRTFTVHEYVDMITACGFKIERIFADWEDEPPQEESERIFFQVRK